ncbi:hypothetical protein DYB32_000375, partial [Aphanomyces invadans]
MDEPRVLSIQSHVVHGYVGNRSAVFPMQLLGLEVDVLNTVFRVGYVPRVFDYCEPFCPWCCAVDIYRDEVLPLADIITPNQFECELLSGQTLTSDADVVAACRMLHALGPRIVVVSSFTPPDEPHRLWLYASEAVTVNGRQLSNMYKMEVPRLPAYYSGTGDLFAALLLAWLAKHPTNLKLVLETVVATVQAVMRRTNDAQSAN